MNGAIARRQTLTGTRGDGGFAVRLVSTGGAGTSDDDGDGDLEVLDVEGDGIVVAPSTVSGRQKQLTVELRWRARVAHASVAVGGTVRVDDRDGVRLDLVGSDPDGGTHAPTTVRTLLRDLRTELAATPG